MNRQNTALVLIDLQKESNFGLEQMEQVVSNARDLINGFREQNIPIIYTRQINREDGVGLSLGEPLNEDGSPFYYNTANESIEILDEIKPEDGDIVIDKYRWSAFHETSLDLTLRSLNVEHVVIGGVVTDGCLLTSVFDAYFRDYKIHLIKDICAASNTGSHMAAMMMMANWIYNLNIYDTTNILNRINGEAFDVWKSEAVDSLQYTPDTMQEVFNKLNN
ncbi:cysteine hydrolase [Aquibacillus koreensis]|uniref:Cysteine hydrolase n=1 Tax=Aquibacillus koreensis TaxID=279446 RepID=A0A9X3WLK6_9BACI|nr:isochorismatase family cysteine hydrolase [Aquibacillus koreensis]MCT2536526.1 cysteine hydrolase [Aquibacillus koreensis]MDC3419386.1 cysteine hydrolase [Aquibacillus koreensis]